MANAQNVRTATRTTFLDALRVSEFRVLWMADGQSAVGDQLARVALSVLVFEHTSSPLLTALAYSLTFLPALIGGALMSGLADRFPRRRVMIAADLTRAGLLALMAIPSTPLWLVCALLVGVVLVSSSFSAAELALLPEILSGETYVVGTGLRAITNQTAQLAGFAFGGMAVATIGARAGLAVDAATFAISSALITFGVRRRPAPADRLDRNYLASIGAGAKLVARTPRLRTLLAFSWLLGLYVVPEGVAPPYAHALGAGSAGIGLLLAAGPAGTALGTYSFVRWVPADARAVWMPRLAMVAGLPLVVCWLLRPGIEVSIVLWLLSGMFTAYQVQVVTEYARAVPANRRAQAIGVASSGLLASQGLGILLGGVVAAPFGATAAVGVAGLVAAVLAVRISQIWKRITPAGQPVAADRDPVAEKSPAEKSLGEPPVAVDPSSRVEQVAVDQVSSVDPVPPSEQPPLVTRMPAPGRRPVPERLSPAHQRS
ncbi:MAG: MFS transporter [Actinobacteria bacterium]|nr:MFS transporter [Actinomycetota bacterium]